MAIRAPDGANKMGLKVFASVSLFLILSCGTKVQNKHEYFQYLCSDFTVWDKRLLFTTFCVKNTWFYPSCVRKWAKIA